jgi:hypothetical protein
LRKVNYDNTTRKYEAKMSIRKAKGPLGVVSLMVFISVVALMSRAIPASAAGNCLKDQYGKNVTCTANDVSVAFADRPRTLSGAPLTECTQGSHFDFVADFHVKTTATARENIGLYFQTAGGSNALTGTCSDNIISPSHKSSNSADTVMLGSNNYEEFDASLAGDTCGDTSSSDPGGEQVVTVEVDQADCEPGANGMLALPNCTSWQQPGGAILCKSPDPNWPYVNAAVPGSPSKCNCENGFTVPIFVSPNIAMTKSCSVNGGAYQSSCSMDDPGGTVTYKLTLTNGGGSATINQICDSAYGDIADAAGYAGSACAAGTTGAKTGTTCSLPQTIGANGYSCTFTARQGESTTVTDTANATGVGSDGTTAVTPSSNSVTVTVGEAATTGTITKSLVSTTNNCATIRYGVDVKNTSSPDETLTISGLTDSQYGVKGDITKLGGGVLGTTCGVTGAGLGTLSGSTGVPFGTIAAGGGEYKCQFDAQFCQTPGPVTKPDGTTCTGIFNTDTVSATLTGDESEPITLTPGTLTVDECITTYTQ